MTLAPAAMAALTDLAVVTHMVVADGAAMSDLTNALGTTMRRQMGIFYFFAGFWKLNSSFMDHRFSCSSIYLAQLLDAYVPPGVLSSEHIQLVLEASPALTVVLECGVGLLMLLHAYFPLPRCGAASVVPAFASEPPVLATYSVRGAAKAGLTTKNTPKNKGSKRRHL